MIRLTFRELDSQGFLSAVKKLNDATGLSGKGIARVTRLADNIDRMIKQYPKFVEAREKLIDKYASREPVMIADKDDPAKFVPQLDAQGNPVTKVKREMTPNGQESVHLGDNVEVFAKEVDALREEMAFEIKVHPVAVDDYLRAKLSPAEIRAASKILEELPEEDDDTEKKENLKVIK